MKTSFKLFTFVGAPVELSLWFFLLFVMLPSVSMVVSVFIAVLIHEMAHAWVANKRGWGVSGIRIDLFTGSAAVDPNIHERDSIPVVAAGPLSNLALVFLTFSILVFTNFLSIDVNNFIYKFILDFITVNFFLFIFNILPIFPMDGGRLVKDFLTLKMRSRLKAKKTAGWISLVTSSLLAIYSLTTANFILLIFTILFIYTALKETEVIKD
jgi:Zn-dependent protease